MGILSEEFERLITKWKIEMEMEKCQRDMEERVEMLKNMKDMMKDILKLIKRRSDEKGIEEQPYRDCGTEVPSISREDLVESKDKVNSAGEEKNVGDSVFVAGIAAIVAGESKPKGEMKYKALRISEPIKSALNRPRKTNPIDDAEREVEGKMKHSAVEKELRAKCWNGCQLQAISSMAKC